MLVFLGLSGMVGAIPMLMHPAGEPWAMPQALLQYSPLSLLSDSRNHPAGGERIAQLWVLWLTVRQHPGYGWWLTAQGCVLSGWLVGEIVLLRLVMWAQYMYGAVAMALVVSGIAMARAAIKQPKYEKFSSHHRS